MSDADVKMILKEKNIEITKNKLILDVENNIDSLKRNIENIFYLEINYIEKILLNDYHFADEKFMDNIKEKSLQLIEPTEQKFISLCREFIYKQSLNKNFYIRYEKYLHTLDTIFEEPILGFVHDLRYLIKKFIDDEEKTQIVYKVLNKKYKDRILLKVNIQVKERNNIIINNAKETYKKYLLLDKNTK